jgi:hypothetical protein
MATSWKRSILWRQFQLCNGPGDAFSNHEGDLLPAEAREASKAIKHTSNTAPLLHVTLPTSS